MSSLTQQLRHQYADQFRSLKTNRSIARCIAIIFANVGSAGLVSCLSFWIWHVDMVVFVPAYLAAIVFIGTRFRAVSNIVHECVHYAFAQHRRANDLFGRLLSVLTLSSFTHYRTAHLSHHRYTGDYERDLDFKDYREFRYEDQMNWRTLRRHLLTGLLLRHVFKYVGKTGHDENDPWYVNTIRLIYLSTVVLLCSGLAGWTASCVVTLYLVVPFLTTFQIMIYWSDVMDHGGLIDQEDEFYRTRNSCVTNPVLRTLFFPRQDCYHLAHHLFPNVPIEFLGRCHEALLNAEFYANRTHSIIERASAMLRDVDPRSAQQPGG